MQPEQDPGRIGQIAADTDSGQCERLDHHLAAMVAGELDRGLDVIDPDDRNRARLGC